MLPQTERGVLGAHIVDVSRFAVDKKVEELDPVGTREKRATTEVGDKAGNVSNGETSAVRLSNVQDLAGRS